MASSPRPPIRIIPQGEIAGGLKEPPAFRLPDPHGVFADRAARFDVLAASATGDAGYLRLMGQLARAQHTALSRLPAPAAVPDAAHLERCAQHGLPPLGTDTPLDAAWRGALACISGELRDAPAAVGDVLDGLLTQDAAALDAQAQRLLSLDYPALDAASVPFIGAALQVHWVRRVAALGEGALKKLDVPTVCPACGSPPVASVLRIDVPVPGTRYLHCALCATDWYMARGKCSQCEAQDKLAYFHIEGGNAAVRGEACEECRGYIKSFNHEKDAQADPFADDLASLALDILLDESGYERASPNCFFVPGQS